MLLAATAACYSENNKQASGWHYRSPSSQQVARIDYVFNDPDTRLVGRCDGGPTFYLIGGDYPDGARQFTLVVDGKSWQLPVTYHAHGRFLAIDEPTIQAAVVQAKSLITLRTGKWERQLRPSPLIQRYAADCS